MTTGDLRSRFTADIADIATMLINVDCKKDPSGSTCYLFENSPKFSSLV